VIKLADFSRLNTMLGFAGADHALQIVAHRLSVACGATLAGRLCNAEMAVYWGATEAASSRQSLTELRRELTVGTKSFLVDLRVGFVQDSGHGEAERLVRGAYTALGRTTAVASNNWYSQSDEEAETRRSVILNGLETASLDDFNFVAQPIVNLITREVESFELLTRWDCPGLGPVPPDEFFGLAGATGKLAELTELSLCQALQVAYKHDLPGISVNISPGLLSDPSFADMVLRSVTNAGIAPSRLTIELLETSLLPEKSAESDVLDRLHSRGISLSVDDFGTGFSNLSYLIDRPISEIKVAGVFTQSINTNSKARRMIAAVNEFATECGARVVAEGAESAEQIRALRELGCVRVQGYAVAHPMPLANLGEFLSQWRSAVNTGPALVDHQAGWSV